MSKAQDYWQQIDEAFFKDGYNLAKVYIPNKITKESLFKAQKALYEQIEEVITAFEEQTKSQDSDIECKKGCSFCCHQTVLATPLELFYLAEFVDKKYTGSIKDHILNEAENRKNKTTNLKTSAALKVKHPCPLLHPKMGYCRAYKARPMACRIYLSSSVKSCKEDLNTPNDDSIYPKLFELPLRAGKMMNEGFLARIREGKLETLQVFENTIEEGMLSALKTDAFHKWIQEKKVFKKMN